MNVYEIITNKFVEAIEAGNNPFWVKPWVGGIAPRNFATGRAYRGINIFWLSLVDQDRVQLYATFNQIKNLGGAVAKGSKARQVTFWKIRYKNADGEYISDKRVKAMTAAERAELDKTFSLRYYNVFNIEDTTGIDVKKYTDKYGATAEVAGADIDTVAEAYMRGTGARFKTGTEAYYSPVLDTVTLPRRDAFKGTAEFYGTAFHEATHWTGHSSRLDRDLSAGVMDKGSYAKEELVAEMGAAFLRARFGFDTPEVTAQSAAYLQGWLTPLKSDTKLIVHAAARSQAAVEYMDELNGIEVKPD